MICQKASDVGVTLRTNKRKRETWLLLFFYYDYYWLSHQLPKCETGGWKQHKRSGYSATPYSGETAGCNNKTFTLIDKTFNSFYIDISSHFIFRLSFANHVKIAGQGELLRKCSEFLNYYNILTSQNKTKRDINIKKFGFINFVKLTIYWYNIYINFCYTLHTKIKSSDT